VSGLDSLFTFISKRIIDEGIIARNTEALTSLLTYYGGLIFVQALLVFGLHLHGGHPGRAHPL
jgi:hypothetical protein